MVEHLNLYLNRCENLQSRNEENLYRFSINTCARAKNTKLCRNAKRKAVLQLGQLLMLIQAPYSGKFPAIPGIRS